MLCCLISCVSHFRSVVQPTSIDLSNYSELKNKISGDCFVVLLSLSTEHQAAMAQAQKEQETQQQSDLDALQKKHDAEMKALQMRFNEELAAERVKLEEEKEADLARLQEALSGSLSEQQELQLQMLKEQHDRELEAVREELVRTHMEKFTEMTARLETEHEVCLILTGHKFVFELICLSLRSINERCKHVAESLCSAYVVFNLTVVVTTFLLKTPF